MEKKTIVYLCHPYSSPEPDVMKARFKSANQIAAVLMQEGYAVFSPLSHSCPIADEIENHLSYDFWLGQDIPLLRLCDEVWVPLVQGWAESKGVNAELDEARRLFKPVVYFRVEDGKISNMVRVQTVEIMGPAVHPGELPGGDEDGQV